MDKKVTLIGIVLAILGILLIAQNPTHIYTACWERIECHYYGRYFIWKHNGGFGVIAWVGTVLNAAGAICIAKDYLPEKAASPIRALFGILAFIFFMSVGIGELID